jgi:C1A family cysteine protease
MVLDPRVTLFKEFQVKYGRTYSGEEEEERRFDLFVKTLEKIDELNKLNVAAGGDVSFGITDTADRDEDEKTHMRGRANHYDDRFEGWPVRQPTEETAYGAHFKRNAEANFVDWRGTATTSVKNQGQCGSCWAFSATEQIESEFMLSPLTSVDTVQQFSPQQIASCTTVCDGCGGGDTTSAYDYLMNTAGVPGLSSDWFIPYAQGMTPNNACTGASCTQTCDYNLTQLVVDQFYIGPYGNVQNFSYATDPSLCGSATLHCNTMDEATLQSNLNNAPASVCVNAGAWDSYTGGVLTSAACGNNGNLALDHCVQAVGYNASAPTPYWIVRNSWSTNWGEEGYIYLGMGDNTCGICNEATVVDVAADSA